MGNLTTEEKRNLVKEFLPIDKTTMQLFHEVWNTLTDYTQHEKSLNLLFKTFPHNTNVDDVLLKCTVLNEFYSAGINSIDLNKIANKIVELNIDEHLQNGNWDIVVKIASCLEGKKQLSFASKYCNWHNHNAFPIYDKHVVNVLCTFKGASFVQFKTFKEIRENTDIKSRYYKFGESLKSFAKNFNLFDDEELSFKLLDRFVWLLGKLCFGEEITVSDIAIALGEIIARESYTRYKNNKALTRRINKTTNKSNTK